MTDRRKETMFLDTEGYLETNASGSKIMPLGKFSNVLLEEFYTF